MATMQAVYYRNADGWEPVRDYIDRLSPEVQDELDWHIDLLNGLTPTSPPLAFPYSSQVTGELRELRCKFGSVLNRVLYRRSRNPFILLHVLEKRSRTIPQADIELALARWEDFQERMNAVPCEPPRAAGHDAL